jgi:CheY-like chemotaxis protein
VSNEAATAAGDKSKTVETYSVSIPGAVGDGSLHLVKRAITAQQTSSTGQQVTQQRVEQANPGDPGSGLQVTTVTIDTVRPGASGAQATRTIQARDANGSFPVISVDTTKSDNIHAIQVQIAPSAPPAQPKEQSK